MKALFDVMQWNFPKPLNKETPQGGYPQNYHLSLSLLWLAGFDGFHLLSLMDFHLSDISLKGLAS